MKTLIRNGTVVGPEGRRAADVLVDGERIVEVGAVPDTAADLVIDARGKLVLPGGVDVHTHLDMALGDGIRTADDFETGTMAAACGGTTTVVDYVTPSGGTSLREALDDSMRRADGRAVIDYGFHMSIPALGPATETEMQAMVAAGVPSFKVFMAYPGRLMLGDGEILRVLRRAARIGGLVCLHAENGPVIDVLVSDALAAGHVTPRFHAVTRPPLAEIEAVRRAVALAELAGAPLYIVHLSTDGSLRSVAEARRHGLPIFAETCPQYLHLSDEFYDVDGLEAAKYVMSPPLRPEAMQNALWTGLAAGDLQVVGTDHCPFSLEQKAFGLNHFPSIPNGAPGIEMRMLLLYQGACDGRLTLERFVEVTASAPARLFGLHPRKGVVASGSDADLVILDPAGATTFSAATHHMRVDYNPYEARVVSGAIDTVLSRGTVVVDGGRFVGRSGHGRFLPREAFSRPEL